MTSSKVAQSGTFNQIPVLLPYPKISKLTDRPELLGMFSYLIKPYKLDGTSLLYYRSAGQIIIKMGNWSGKEIDLTKYPKHALYITQKVGPILSLLNAIGANQALMFFSNDDDPVLVDVQLSLNKMLSPGMIMDTFGRVMKTQEILGTRVIDGTEKNMIIKPSNFKIVPNKQPITPLYAIA